jgi:predicted Zn-dependent protease
VLEHKFSQAEPYLLRCRHLKPELASRVHILLGRVYAETGRTAEAIAEYKQGLSIDEDGSLHYQIARLYRKSGNSTAAATAMRQSQLLRQQWDNQAHIDLGQPLNKTGPQ